MRIFRLGLRILSVVLAASLCGCSLSPYNLEDPQKLAGIGPSPSKVIKSIRCEMAVFIEENKLRTQMRDILLPELRKEFTSDKQAFEQHYGLIQSYPSIPIDSTRFASLIVELKNVDTFSALPGIDLKYLRRAVGSSDTFHIGPSYVDTRTFDLNVPLAIKQAAGLGPTRNFVNAGMPQALPAASQYSTAYFSHPSVDEPFYCFKSLSKLVRSSTLTDAVNDIQHLLRNDDGWGDYSNFDRIHVGDMTLAEWLQKTGAEISENERTVFDASEAAYTGQLNYYFILDLKPGLDFKYTLIADVYSPGVSDSSLSLEHVGTFSIYLNTANVAAALNAKSGNAIIGAAPADRSTRGMKKM